MKTLIATTILTVCLSSSATGQRALRVTYEGTDNALKEYFEKMRSFNKYENSTLFAEENEKNNRRTTLITDGSTSVFIENEEMSEEELEDSDGPQIIYVSEEYWGEERRTYKDLKGRTTLTEQVYSGKTFYFSGQLPSPDWEMTDSKATIMGMECQKATLGDSVAAWFTMEIPVPDGPSLAYGLPGLVLRLDDGHEQYECVGIEEAKGGVPSRPKPRRTLTLQEFKHIVEKDINNIGNSGDDF